MTNAIKSAIARSSFNSITGKDQFPWDQEDSSYQNFRSRFSPNHSARGGFNTRGRGRPITPLKPIGQSYRDVAATPKKGKRTDPALKDAELFQNQTLMRTRLQTNTMGEKFLHTQLTPVTKGTM